MICKCVYSTCWRNSRLQALVGSIATHYFWENAFTETKIYRLMPFFFHKNAVFLQKNGKNTPNDTFLVFNLDFSMFVYICFIFLKKNSVWNKWSEICFKIFVNILKLIWIKHNLKSLGCTLQFRAPPPLPCQKSWASEILWLLVLNGSNS